MAVSLNLTVFKSDPKKILIFGQIFGLEYFRMTGTCRVPKDILKIVIISRSIAVIINI